MFDVMPEHINVFIPTPFISPNDIVNLLKGVTSKRVFEKFFKLRKKEFLGTHLWSPSYYVGIHGQRSTETIKKYVGSN